MDLKDDTPQPDDIVISPSKVSTMIAKLKSDKIHWSKCWPIEVIKQYLQQISILLSCKLFRSGVLPHDWKVAYITPIHKRGSSNVAGNYRPVSLTFTIMKIMESIVLFKYFRSLNF